MIFLGGLISIFSGESRVALAKSLEECPACPGEGAIDNPCTENSFTRWIQLYPSETTVKPREEFGLRIDWYRTCYCPSDYFKILYRHEATGEITEAGRHAEPYWTMCSSYCTESHTLTLTAPTEPGIYTVKVVHASGHGENWCGYYTVNWGCPRSDGDFVGHAPEELSWDFYEVATEFYLWVSHVRPPDRDEAFKEMDEKWGKLSNTQRAEVVKNTDTFNRFTARYATLTGKQVEDIIARSKATNPAYAYIDTKLVKGLISVESSNNFLALSSKGALGLGQKLTGTIDTKTAFTNLQNNLDLSSFKYQNLAFDDRTLPERNIDMTLNYIDYLNKRPFISNNVDKMLAAYNGGEGRLWSILRDPEKRKDWLNQFPKETRDYVEKIKNQSGIR